MTATGHTSRKQFDAIASPICQIPTFSHWKMTCYCFTHHLNWGSACKRKTDSSDGAGITPVTVHFFWLWLVGLWRASINLKSWGLIEKDGKNILELFLFKEELILCDISTYILTLEDGSSFSHCPVNIQMKYWLWLWAPTDRPPIS